MNQHEATVDLDHNVWVSNKRFSALYIQPAIWDAPQFSLEERKHKSPQTADGMLPALLLSGLPRFWDPAAKSRKFLIFRDPDRRRTVNFFSVNVTCQNLTVPPPLRAGAISPRQRQKKACYKKRYCQKKCIKSINQFIPTQNPLEDPS